MYSFNIEIADFVFNVQTKYSYTHNMCKNYLTFRDADYSIKISDRDISYERIKNLQETGFPYGDDYLEFLAVYRKIADILLDEDVLLCHGSAVSLDGQCYLFTAKSGTGKSTHAQQWLKLFKDRAFVVNDDKPMLKFCGDKIWVYGTPWNGKANLDCNIKVPLKSVAFLHRDVTNHIEKSTDVFKKMYPQVYRPSDSKRLMKVISLVDRLSKNVPMFDLFCNISTDAALLAYSEMKGDKNEA